MHEYSGSGRGGIGSLLRFLGGYAFVLLVLFFALPAGGRFLEARYDAMDGTDKLLLAATSAMLVGAWWWLSRRRRMRPTPGRF